MAWLLVAVVTALPVVTAADDRPVIARAELYLAGSLLVSDIECRSLFSEQVVGTVQSGLPASVELTYRVLDGEDDVVRRGVHAFGLTYDVWDDIYTVDRGDTVLTFTTFEAMGRMMAWLRAVPVGASNGLDQNARYVVEFSVAVRPLAGREQKRIVGWVDDTVRGPSAGSWREQLLNVNDLIHRFFSRRHDTANRSEVFRTPPFTMSSLRHSGAGASRVPQVEVR